MGRAKDLNPLGQTGEQPGAVHSVETLWIDSILESSGTHWFMEDSTTAVDGVGGGERLASTAGNSMEMPGATTRTNESSKARVGAADVVLESGV